MFTPWDKSCQDFVIDYDDINLLNRIFDNLFVMVHHSFWDKDLSPEDKSTSASYFQQISDLIYKPDNDRSKYEILGLIYRRSYLLTVFVNKSKICDEDFRASLYELFWFVEDLLKKYSYILLDESLND